MKKLGIIILAAALIVTLATCKGAGQPPGSTSAPPPTATEPAPPAETTESPPGVSVQPPDTTMPQTPPAVTDPTPPPAELPADAFVFTTENMPVIDGSTATIPLIEAVYSVLLGVPRDDAARMVNTSGTDNAYEKLIWGDADILLVYSPSPSVFESAKYNDVELEMTPIGRDGLVFLVNIANPVKSLKQTQIVSIYSGETRNWKDIGGEDARIEAFQRPYRSGSQTMMDELVMKGVPMAEAEAEYVIGEMGGLIEAVATYDNARAAIGYNVYYFVSQMEMNENVRMLAVDGVAPSTQSISDGSYPFVSDFYAVIRSDAPEGSPERILYDWIRSADGQNLVKHEGYATAG